MVHLRQNTVWSNSDFVKLWLAITLSQFGIQITHIGLPLIAINLLEASSFEVSILNISIFVPSILIGLFAGVWVDKWKRKPVLMISDVARAMILLSIPAVILLGGHVFLWQLYIVGFLSGFFTVFFDIAYRSYLPSLLHNKQLVQGNSALEAGNSASQITGASAAGVLIAMLTAPIAILGNVITFIISFTLLLAIKKREPSADVPKNIQKSSMRREIREGIQYVFQNQWISPLVKYTIFAAAGWSMMEGIYMVYMVRDLAIDSRVIGIIFGVSHVGLLTGAMMTQWLTTRIGVGVTILTAGLMQAIGMMLIPLAPVTLSIPMIILGLTVRSFGVIVSNVTQVSIRQMVTSPSMLGKVNGTTRFIGWGIIPLGYVLGGTLSLLFGVRLTLWVASAVSLLALLPLLLSPVRTLHDLAQLE